MTLKEDKLGRSGHVVDSLSRKDGWGNALTGLSKKQDKTSHSEPGRVIVIDDQTLSDMYDAPGYGSVIIDTLPNDMIKEGWEFENDGDKLIEKEMTRLEATSAINKAVKYTRVYRGAIIVMVTEKGAIGKPLKETDGKITHLKVYSAARLEDVSTTDIISDPKSKYFDDVEFFNVRLLNGDTIKAHRSRCLVFKGEDASDYGDIDLKYKYWGLAVFQKIFDSLNYYETTIQSIANKMQEFNIGKYTMANLASILASNDASSVEKIYTRMNIINTSKSVLNAVLLGDGESYETETTNLTGIPEVIDRMMMHLAGVARIPVTKLFGRSAAGENATGVGDSRDYYDSVHNVQELWLRPRHQRLVDFIAGYIYPGSADEYLIEYNSLWEPTDKEKAEVEKLNADTDAIYIDRTVISDEEVRTNRFPDLDGGVPDLDDLENEEEEEEIK